MDKQELRKYFLEDGFDSYVFYAMDCSETELAEVLNSSYDELYALVLKRMIHRSDHGRKWDEESLLIRNYVFIYLPKDYDVKDIRTNSCSFRILKWKIDNGKLYGDDYAYAKWVLEQNGLIGVSKAIKVNEKVKIVAGPLQELEGFIVEYSKRNRNCCVELEFMNQKIRTWLPFEWTDQNYIMEK